jgi:hypothetical protein
MDVMFGVSVFLEIFIGKSSKSKNIVLRYMVLKSKAIHNPLTLRGWTTTH